MKRRKKLTDSKTYWQCWETEHEAFCGLIANSMFGNMPWKSPKEELAAIEFNLKKFPGLDDGFSERAKELRAEIDGRLDEYLNELQNSETKEL